MNQNRWTTQSVTLWIYSHFKQLLLVVSFPLLGLVGVLGWMEWEDRKEQGIYQTLYVFSQKFQKIEEKENGQGYRNQDDNLASLMSKKKKEKPLIFSEEMEKVAQSYTYQIQQYKGSLGGAAFAIDLAHFYMTHNKKEEAIKILEWFALPQKKQGLYHLVSVQLANYYTDLNKCSQAIPLWQGLLSNKKASYFHKEASLQLGLCYESQGQYSQAEEVYNKIALESSNEFDVEKAKEYKHLMLLHKRVNQND